MTKLAWRSFTTIRWRLGAALAVALIPVLMLGALQSEIAFHKYADERQTNLALAASRSAATAKAQMESAAVLLQTLTPQAMGFQCADRLATVAKSVKGYDNLIRLDAAARVECSAASTPADPARSQSDWFRRLAAGESLILGAAPPSISAGDPALLAANRATDAEGRFDGALVAVISLSSLRPSEADPDLPPGTQVALVDRNGRFLTRTDTDAFPPTSALVKKALAAGGSAVNYAVDAAGEKRDFSAAPLGGDIFVVLSAPDQGLFSWAKLNPLSSVFFPLLTFLVALFAVLMVTERVVVRWLHYLQRIAEIYAKGRFTVRPLQADHAPPEIRELALSLESMADAIATRDASLLNSLAQKDALMREIHHRVRNNLQVISSLLNMQQRSLADPAARDAMSDTRQRINALALIYRSLYQGPDLKRVDLREFLAELIAQLAGEQQHHGQIVATELEADELIIDPNKLAPLALFAVEAISNAQKHALAHRGGVLRVKFAIEGETANLSIADEGSGSAPELEPANAGVGRALMNAFARQLRGRAELTANSHGGVTASLIFPTPAAAADATPQAPASEKAKGKGGRAAA